jgi:integron integrase
MTKPKKLLDQVRDLIRTRHYSIRTEDAYVSWIKRYIFFHGKRHPQDMGTAEIEAFLTHLATERNVAASTQNQAFNAILFLYREVLNIEIGTIESVRAKKPARLPTVLTREECLKIIGAMTGVQKLMTQILFGSGLRAMECLRLRVKDIDFEMNQIVVRDGKGQKDRVTIFPETLQPGILEHLKRVRAIHEKDLADGFGKVYLPYALSRKYPKAEIEWGWKAPMSSAKAPVPSAAP